VKRITLAISAAFLLFGSAFAPREACLAAPLAQRWPHGDPEVVVRSILAQPAYRTAPATADRLPEPTIWDRLQHWIGERIRDLLERFAHLFHGARGAGKPLGVLLLIVSGAALLVLLVRLLTRLTNRSRSPVARNGSEALSTERSAAVWHALSLETASQGRYGAAVAALFMAALRLLDERRILAFDAARTPNEYRRRIARTLATASPAFDQLALCFVRATYAQILPERAVYDTAARAYVAFSSEIPVS
jgi:hypothetical protein